MKYLHVAGNETRSGRVKTGAIIARQTGHCLYSIIGGFRKKNFGLESIYEEALRIRKYIGEYLTPVDGRLFTDSGGYSIIKGDIHPNDIQKLTTCYNTYLEFDREFFTYIFSLDIPMSLKYNALNNQDVLYRLNREAWTEMKNLLEKYPDLREKLYFVWHFKMASQYQIWSQLYGELGLDRVVKHRAIGGMVGVREMTKRAFSPFTPIAYRCLLDYLNAPETGSEFRLHFLGMYIPYDRFQIALLEALFSDYLRGISGVELTYDSINYSHTARMNNIKAVYEFDQGELQSYSSILGVPEYVLRAVYGDSDRALEEIGEELDRKKRYQKLHNAAVFAPLNVYSNLMLDRYFEWIIRKYELVDVLRSSKSWTVLLGRIHPIFSDLKSLHGNVFTEQMRKSMQENLEITHLYDGWFKECLDYESLNRRLAAFIGWLGFPDMIR